MSGSTRRVGLMAQSVQVNYSLSWEEARVHLSADCGAQF